MRWVLRFHNVEIATTPALNQNSCGDSMMMRLLLRLLLCSLLLPTRGALPS